MERVLYFLLWITILEPSEQIYVPDDGFTQKPVTYTPEIDTSAFRTPWVQLHHNYSKVYHQSGSSSNYQSTKTSHHRYPVYIPPGETYVLNGSKIRKTANPTRQIVIYNKEKRSPKVQIYKSCPQGASGQFVYDSSCHQFLNCWKGRGYVQNCSPGTLFNPKTLECDFPEKVNCISGPREVLQSERTHRSVQQVGCPKEFSGLIPNYTDCSKFINCVSGIENHMDCPSGTLFDINKNVCDFAHKAACFNGENRKLTQKNIDGKLDFGSTSQKYQNHQQLQYKFNEIRCPLGVQGLHPHPSDCSRFLNCADGQTHIQSCGPGTLFNPSLKICDFPYNVRCGSSTSGGVIDYDARNESVAYHHGTGSGTYSSGTDQSLDEGGYYKSRDTQYGGGTGNQYPSGSLAGHYITSPNPYRTSYGSSHQGSRVYGVSNQYDQNQYSGGSQTSTNDQNQYSGAYGSHQNRDSTSQIYSSSRPNGQNPFLSNQDSSGSRYNQGTFGHRTQPTSYTNSYNQNHSQEPTYTGSSVYGSSHNQDQDGSSIYGLSHNQNQDGSSIYGSSHNQNQDGSSIYGSSHNQNQDDSLTYGSSHNQNQGGSSIYGSSHNQNRDGSSIYGSSHNQNHQGSSTYGSSHNQNQDGSSIYGSSHNHNYSQKPVFKGSSTYGSSYNQNHNQEPIPDRGSRTQGTYIYSSGNSYDQNPYNRRPTIQTQGTGGVYDQGTYNSGYGTQGTHGYRPSSSYDQNQYNRGSTDQHPSSGAFDQNHNSQSGYNRGSTSHGTQTYGTSNQNQYNPYGGGLNQGSSNPYDQNEYPCNSQSGCTQNNQYGGVKTARQPSYGTNRNNLDQDRSIDGHTPNYDHVVNINQVRKTTPSRNPYEPFYGTTSKPRVTIFSPSNDYDDYNPGHGTKHVRSTTPRAAEKLWPPPFPSTDVNADYVFEYEDPDGVTLEAENSINHDRNCKQNDFSCTETCVPKTLVCNGVKDCPDGKDERNCLESLTMFSVQKNKKLAILEKERWDNVSIAACSALCLETQKVHCKSFNYRKVDKTCFLTDTNEGLTGGIISYYPFDYYERISEKVNCSGMYVCNNKKCIEKKKLCDGHDDCGDRMDEKGCKPEDFGYSVKLTGSKTKSEGRIEVTAFGKTGFVCDDNFGLRDASVVCKELGFELGAVEVKKNSFFVTNKSDENTFYMMDDVSCLGNETKLLDCDFSGWGVHNCLGQEAVGVVCKTPTKTCPSDYWQCDTGRECLPLAFVCDGLYDCSDNSDEGSQHCEAPTQFRLVNGTSQREGRVEVRHHGTWGTICDDDFNEDAAKVLCRQLGYKGAVVVKKDAFFGPGSGPIWLDQVFCSGNESNLEECTHWNWGEHNCDHTEDVGVICSSTNEYAEYIERHSMVPVVPQRYPERCGFRNDAIFNRNDDVHFRVVKGSVAKKGDYPWQAALRIKQKTSRSHWCGAVIIHEKFVLTAAHCLVGYPKGAYIVVAGDYNTDEEEGTEQEAHIEDYYLHEDFKKKHKMDNDIALVKLKGFGFQLNDDVQAICLPDSDVDYETNQNCTISGFGSIESGKSAFSHNLRAGWVPLQKKEVCTMPHVYGDALTDGMICAGSLDEGVDSCDGDSGGPLACLNRGVFTLYGLTSWGQHCGYANKPGVYVKVSHYRDWIDDHFKKYSPNNP